MDMHGKIVKNLTTVELKYVSTAENPLDDRVVGLFEELTPEGLARFSIVSRSTGGSEVVFDITRLKPLTEYMAHLQGVGDLRRIFGQMSAMLEGCLSKRLVLKNIVFDRDRVYYDSWSNGVFFIYLPLGGIQADVQKVRGFFQSVPSFVRSADADCQELLNRYSAFFQASDKFNPVDFQRFLKSLASSAPHAGCSDERPGFQAEGQAGGTTNLNVVTSPVSHGVDLRRAAATVSGGTAARFEATSKPATAPQSSADANPPAWKTPAETSRFEERTKPEHGAHARIDPGTTVLDGLDIRINDDGVETEAPDLFQADEGEFDQTTALDADGVVMQRVRSADGEAALPAKRVAGGWLIRRHPHERVALTGTRFSVGKSKYREYQVRDTTTVSRSHAVFICEEDSWWIEDDESKNGTFVNDVRLEPHVRVKLGDGDLIRMSDEEFTFELSKDAKG